MVTMVPFLHNLFADKLLVDDREPIYKFTLWGEQWGLLAPKLHIWEQLLTLLLLQVFFQLLAAAINYYIFVLPRKKQQQAKHSFILQPYQYLIGWGIIIPVACAIPYQILDVLQVGNRAVKLTVGSMVFIILFRTIEAMCNTSPPCVETSLAHYCIYYSSIVHFEWDPQTNRRKNMTMSEFGQAVGMVVFFFHFLSLLLSLELYHNFLPFADSPVTNLHEYHFTLDLFTWQHIANNYLLMLTVYATLNFGFRLTCLGEQMKGLVRTKPIFRNPVFGSRSISEFWGKRWDLMIRNVLYFGVFLPVRPHVPNIVAIFLTFIVSGIMHDYSWSLMFHHYDDERTNFVPTFWKLTAFFVWNGIFMVLERPLAPFLSPIGKHLPTVVVSSLLGLTALPVIHWYGGDWVTGGYFADLSLGLWIVQKL